LPRTNGGRDETLPFREIGTGIYLEFDASGITRSRRKRARHDHATRTGAPKYRDQPGR
jgi:hypothetical protein